MIKISLYYRSLNVLQIENKKNTHNVNVHNKIKLLTIFNRNIKYNIGVIRFILVIQSYKIKNISNIYVILLYRKNYSFIRYYIQYTTGTPAVVELSIPHSFVPRRILNIPLSPQFSFQEFNINQ